MCSFYLDWFFKWFAWGITSISLMQVYVVCLQITPDEFFNTAPKQCRRRQLFVSKSKGHLFHIPKSSASDFFRPVHNAIFLDVFFSTFQVWNCQIFPPFWGLMWKNSEIFLLGSILHQTQATNTDIDAAVPEKNGSWSADHLQPKSCWGCSEAKENKTNWCQYLFSSFDLFWVSSFLQRNWLPWRSTWQLLLFFWRVTGSQWVSLRCLWFGTRLQSLNFEACRCRSSACLPPGYQKKSSGGSLRAKHVDDSWIQNWICRNDRIDFDWCFSLKKIMHIAATAWMLLATKLSLPEATAMIPTMEKLKRVEVHLCLWILVNTMIFDDFWTPKY